MAWSIEFDPSAFAELERLDPPIQKRILRYLRERIATAEDPRRFARPLRGEKIGLWRYRVGAYRVVARSTKSKIECACYASAIVEMSTRTDGKDARPHT